MSAWAAIAAVVVGICLALVAMPAHAAEDEIRNLSVHYDIHSDGSVHVRHEVEWRFSSSGRHGIDFTIATREPWEDDPEQDVVYDVSSIAVESPSGAPAVFTQTVDGWGSEENIELRIGDPDEEVDGRKASYVISYELRGALRTFDGTPEFFWDVTSRDNPTIKQFEVRVSAPDGVTRARCLVGSKECDAGLSGGDAVLTGKNVPRGSTISVVAGIVPGAVTGAEPTFEERRLSSPELMDVVSMVDVLPNGMTHVEQQLTYRLPYDYATSPSYIGMELPTRLPFSRSQDRVYDVSNLTVDGAHLVTVRVPTRRDLKSSRQMMTVSVRPSTQSDTAVLRLSYDVRGAVSTEDDRTVASWIISPVNFYDDPSADFTWNLPADVQQVECVNIAAHIEGFEECREDLGVVKEGNTVSWTADSGSYFSTSDAWLNIEVPAVAVGGAGAILEPSLDAAAAREKAWAIGGAAATLVAFGGAGALIGRARISRSRRWADVSPGVSGRAGSRTRPVRRSDNIPVRFNAPDCSLEVAGLVLDQKSSSRHTAALLVRMATVGAIELESSPLQVTCISEEGLNDPLEKALYSEAMSGAKDSEMLQGMNKLVVEEQDKMLRDRSLFRSETANKAVRGGLLLLLPIALIGGLFLPWMFVSGWLGSHGEWFIGAGAVGVFLGFILAMRTKLPAALAPNGTAFKDQAEGFRTYIATAEARQLNFEAGQDIYRRYLPWAVLFGLTDRWTKVCEKLVREGRIADLDTSFWAGSPSPEIVARDTSSFASQLQASSYSSSSSGFSSSGGSGSASGFSGSSSGGGGGGGSSSSSW